MPKLYLEDQLSVLTAMLDLYKLLKNSQKGENIKEIVSDFNGFVSAMKASTVECDIQAYAKYTEAGISPEHAIQLILSRRQGIKELAGAIGKNIHISSGK